MGSYGSRRKSHRFLRLNLPVAVLLIDGGMKDSEDGREHNESDIASRLRNFYETMESLYRQTIGLRCDAGIIGIFLATYVENCGKVSGKLKKGTKRLLAQQLNCIGWHDPDPKGQGNNRKGCNKFYSLGESWIYLRGCHQQRG